MMTLVRIVAGLHLAVYLGIIWYGWQNYKPLRKKSWTAIGVGFVIFLLYRVSQFTQQMMVEYPTDIETTLVPFVASLFLLAGFWIMDGETEDFLKKMADPRPAPSGSQPVEFWKEESRKMLEEIRRTVHEEIAAASGTTTVTVKGPAAIIDDSHHPAPKE